MRVLVLGSGAREHALCAHLARSPRVSYVAAAPGNPGIATVAEAHAVAADDVPRIVALAQSCLIDLVVVGPEVPLVAGVADALRTAGIACFGPGADGARLEGSKSFSKDFMARHGIPTARYATFSALDAAVAYVRAADHRVVVKADGLAAGKGVVVCDGVDDAVEAVERALRDGAFGDAGRTVVIEERLEGQEISFHAVTDGARVELFGAAQDHKRLGDGDTGPNTGGMGAYSPVPVCTPDLEARVMREVIAPTLDGLRRDGIAFRGVLFVGLMVGADGAPRVLEYNVRFGDPECAVLLARLDDATPWLWGAATGAWPTEPLRPRNDASIGVVIAAEGYPDAPRRGAVIRGLDAAAAIEGVRVFHAGTGRSDGAWVTAGGRVLLVTATAATLRDAAAVAYRAVDAIELAGAQVRRDIGWRAFAQG